MDPTHGLGRVVFASLTQLAMETGHSELGTAKLILLGFSGTGALFAHLVGYSPNRIVAAVLANAGHYDPVGMDHVNLSPDAISVPELIIVGGADEVVGTQRNFDYFQRYRSRGAPWIFLLQNGISHCCVINTKTFVLKWLEEIIKLRRPASTKPLRRVDDQTGWVGFIRPCETSKHDHWGNTLWDVCSAEIQPLSHSQFTSLLGSGWFPDHTIASEWLIFTEQTKHPADSFPNQPK